MFTSKKQKLYLLAYWRKQQRGKQILLLCYRLVNGRGNKIVKISLNSSPFVTDSEIQSYNFIFNYRGVRLYTQCWWYKLINYRDQNSPWRSSQLLKKFTTTQKDTFPYVYPDILKVVHVLSTYFKIYVTITSPSMPRFPKYFLYTQI